MGVGIAKSDPKSKGLNSSSWLFGASLNASTALLAQIPQQQRCIGAHRYRRSCGSSGRLVSLLLPTDLRGSIKLVAPRIGFGASAARATNIRPHSRCSCFRSLKQSFGNVVRLLFSATLQTRNKVEGTALTCVRAKERTESRVPVATPASWSAGSCWPICNGSGEDELRAEFDASACR
jgi:hypothetical protein